MHFLFTYSSYTLPGLGASVVGDGVGAEDVVGDVDGDAVAAICVPQSCTILPVLTSLFLSFLSDFDFSF